MSNTTWDFSRIDGLECENWTLEKENHMPENLVSKLTDLLRTDSRFVDEDGELVKSAVIDRAWRMDRDLVAPLCGPGGVIP